MERFLNLPNIKVQNNDESQKTVFNTEFILSQNNPNYAKCMYGLDKEAEMNIDALECLLNVIDENIIFLGLGINETNELCYYTTTTNG